MIVSITYLKLKSPLHLLSLGKYNKRVVEQLYESDMVDFKSRGFWKNHYTMTLWNNEAEMKQFVHSSAHRDAMNISHEIASEIKTFIHISDDLLNWNEAKKLLHENAKVLTF